jgi:hypothetical protein
MPGKANCCCPARMQHFGLLLAFVARTGARTCRCALERPTFASADVVAAGGSFPTVEVVSAAYGPASGSLALISGSRPLSGDANESLPVAASVLGP